MSLKSSSFLLVTLSILLILFAYESSARKTIVGGWRKIDNVTSPAVVNIGKFAVAEHNKVAKPSLGFVRVLDGETQVVSGIKYRLVLAVAGDGNYTAVVWCQPWRKMKKLLSFEKTRPSVTN